MKVWMDGGPSIPISEIQGMTFSYVYRQPDEEDSDTIRFEKDNGEVFVMAHRQECCESVRIEDICGELSDLEGAPIVVAEERIVETTNDDGEEEWHRTATFYEMRTIKGSVTFRWHGESNGNYSERISFYVERGYDDYKFMGGF